MWRLHALIMVPFLFVSTVKKPKKYIKHSRIVIKSKAKVTHKNLNKFY